MISKQSCWRDEPQSVSGSRVSGFKVVVFCKMTFGFSSRMAWYFPMCPTISQYLSFCYDSIRTYCGVHTIVVCPKVSFSASCKMSQVAATARRHGGHPFVMWSNFLTERLCIKEYFPESGLVPPVQFLAFHECIIWKIPVNWAILGWELKPAFPLRYQMLPDNLLSIQKV